MRPPPAQPSPCAVIIGTFDGVHLGHAALLAEARRRIGPAGRVVVLAFFPHPLSLLRPDDAPSTITDWPRRERLLRSIGADDVIRLDPASGVLDLSSRHFVERLVRDHHPALIVEGPDFRFGKARAGDTDTLRDLGAHLGFDVAVVPPVAVVLPDMAEAPASSTLVRWLLRHGRVRDAAAVLGRPHAMEGLAVRGARRGRGIGMPTVNLASADLAPADGVYAGVARLPSGESVPAAISVGTNPTFTGAERSTEAHLIGWRPLTGPGSPEQEYGWPVAIEFHHWLREQIVFTSVPALLEQMRRDLDRASHLLRAPMRLQETTS